MAESYLHRISNAKGRRHSIAGSGAEANQPRLLAGLFKSHRSRDKPKPKKRSNSLSNGRGGSGYPLSPLLVKPGASVRVIATALHPQVYYKTLPVKPGMTASDVIVALVDRYADSMEDQNPDSFYLTEVQDTPQGCYSRVLENSDKIEELKARWLNEKDFYFCICRKQFIPRCGSLTTESPVEAEVLSPSHSFSDDVFSSTGNNSPGLLISKQLFSSSLVAPVSSCKPSSTDADQNLLVSGSDHLGASLSSVETEGGGARERWTTNHHILQSGSSDGGSLNAESLSISLPGVHAILECPDSEDEPGHDDVYKGHMMRRNSSPLHRFKFPLNPDSTDAGLQSKSISTVIQNSSSSSSNLHYDSQPAPIRKRHYSYSGQQSQGCSNTHRDRSAPPTSLTRSDGKLNQKMKRSISEGLEGIMKKVVGEKKRIDFTASAKVPASGASASKPLSLGGGGVAVRNLVCSPVAAVEKRYPEFVFTPGHDHESKEKKDSNGNGNELLDGSEAILEDTSCNLDLNGSQLTDSEDQQNSSQNLNADSVSTPQQDEKEEHDVCMKQVEAGLPPYNHWRTTSRTFSNVTFEARLTVAPRFHCTASVYLSFLKGSCQFNTEMNILESISTLLNNNSRTTEQTETDSTTANGDNKGHMEESPGLIPKIMPPSQSDSAASNGGEENCYIMEESPSLISKSRRTKLINRAASAVVHKNKTKSIEMRHTPLDGKQANKPTMPQSTENDDKQLQTESNTVTHQTTWTASPLISMKRRTQLIKLAASRFKKRRKGAAEHQSAKNDEPLIHTQTPSEDRSVTESSATSDIALPTTHEHASSCVLYTSTITIPAAAATHSRLHFSQQGEMPSDLDRLISSLPSSPRKRDKGVSFQRVSSADERRNKINYTYEETRPLTIRQNSEPHLYARLTQSPTSPRFNVIQPASLNNGHNSRSDFAHKIRPKSAHSVGSHHHHDNNNTTTFSNQLQEDKAYKSLEALPSSQQREVLYTFPSNKRPITVVVKGAIIAKSFPSLDESSSRHDPDLPPLNATLKPASSQPVITTQYVQVRADKRYKCWSTQL